MKPTIYLTDPEAMRQARLNQPQQSSEDARNQRLALRRASEPPAPVAKLATSKRGLAIARA